MTDATIEDIHLNTWIDRDPDDVACGQAIVITLKNVGALAMIYAVGWLAWVMF